MSKETLEKLDAALQHVPPSRRDLLKRLLLGAVAVLLAPVSEVLAAGNKVGDCINDKLHSPPFNYDYITAKMKGSAVVLTGTSARKAALTKMAKQCGATKVTNNVVVPSGGDSSGATGKPSKPKGVPPPPLAK